MSITKADYDKYFKPFETKLDLIQQIASSPHACLHADDIPVMKHVIENDLPEMKKDIKIIKEKVINGNIKKDIEEGIGARLDKHLLEAQIFKDENDKLKKERKEGWRDTRTKKSWWNDLTVPKKIGVFTGSGTLVVMFADKLSDVLQWLSEFILTFAK